MQCSEVVTQWPASCTFLARSEPVKLDLRLKSTSPPREADLCDFLKDDFEVAVIPGLDAFFGPGSRGHLRLAVATSIPLLDQALDRLDAGLRAWAQR